MADKKQLYKIPYGECNFEFIREEGFLYVDKTQFIARIEMMTKLIHLRPRRFGKSLFVSMLESYYDIASADKFDQLFSGLYIYDHPTQSKNNHYVLHFDFSGIQTTNMETIDRGFLERVRSAAQLFVSKYGFDLTFEKETEPAIILSKLLAELEILNPQHKVCILIDEYDHFTNAVLNNGIPEFMTLVERGGMVRSFYEVIKIYCGRSIVGRFFITGVMSVSLDSMTSGFNIATNITTEEAFS